MKRLFLFAVLCAAPAAFAQEEPAATEGHEEEAPPIEYKWLNFVILTAGVGYLIATKAMPALAERGHYIEKALKAAEQIKADAAAEEAAIDRKMAGLKAEIEAMRSAAKQEMETERARMTAETQALVAKLQANAEGEIAILTKQAQNALRAQASELALSLARRKVTARVNAAADSHLIAGFVGDLKKMQEARN